jgi:AraC family transcriptional activator of tynA and feaB
MVAAVKAANPGVPNPAPWSLTTVTRYDATTLREQDRFPYWQDLICRLFPRAAGRRGDDHPFEANLQRTLLGTMDVSDIRCNALRYDRARQDMRSDDNEDFLISLMLSGRARLEQNGRVTEQGPGDFVLYDAAQPFVYDFPSDYHILLAQVPRRAMLSRLLEAERLTAVSVSSSTPLGNMAALMMRSAVTLDLPAQTTASAKVGVALVDVISAAIEAEVADRAELRDRQAGLLKRAKDYMRARIDDPELDVEAIANALFVSPRTLSRAFATEGITVIRWLWKQRLEVGYAALSEGTASQVSDVAMGCGFVSGSHFSRMFKSTYGVLPHTLLRGGRHPDDRELDRAS